MGRKKCVVPGRLEVLLQFDVGQRFDLQFFRQIFRHLQELAVIRSRSGQRLLAVRKIEKITIICHASEILYM